MGTFTGRAIMISALCITCILLPVLYKPLPESSEVSVRDFVVSAKAVVGVEGGPFGVKVTLEYKGKKDIVVRWANFWNNSRVLPDDSDVKWSFWPLDRNGTIGRPYEKRTLKPGDKWSEIHYVHHWLRPIPQGKIPFKISWPIHEVGEKTKEYSAEARLIVDIQAARKETLDLLCEDLERKFLERPIREEDLSEVIDFVRNTRHSELAPIIWRLIESPEGTAHIQEFVETIYATSSDATAVNDRLIGLITDPHYCSSAALFWYWYRKHMKLSPNEASRLLGDKSMWIRTLAYAAFPGRCDDQSRASLFDDIREAQRALPEGQVAKLVAEIDDDDFAIRDRASTELEKLGERVREQLLQALQARSSVESQYRIRLLLSRIPDAPPPIVRETLNSLEYMETSESKAILRLFAEGASDLWTTKQSTIVLRKTKENRENKEIGSH
jgi:hypothetical protein